MKGVITHKLIMKVFMNMGVHKLKEGLHSFDQLLHGTFIQEPVVLGVRTTLLLFYLTKKTCF